MTPCQVSLIFYQICYLFIYFWLREAFNPRKIVNSPKKGHLCMKWVCRGYMGSVWLKSQVERSRSVPVLLLFGYKITRMEWLQLGNILLRSGTIPLQKINGTEPLRSNLALTVTLRSVHSATKQKTEPLHSRLPNTEQSGSVPRIRNRTAPFYLAHQPNTTMDKWYKFLRNKQKH
jgi:hypothetical protein